MKRTLVYVVICILSFVLLCEVMFCACGWYWALKVTGPRYLVVPIVVALLAVGWAPLLWQQYTRRTFLFGMLVMVGAFAITAAVMAMLTVTGEGPRLLKPMAIVSVSWIAGGLWGWAITYLDQHKWRIGEKLSSLAFGRGPMDDARARRPFVVVAMVTMLALAVVGGIWAIGREKLFREVWRESNYSKRIWLLQTRIIPRMFDGCTEKQLEWYFGKEHGKVGSVAIGQGQGSEATLKWLIGTAEIDPNSPVSGQQAWLNFKMRDGQAVDMWVEYTSTGEKVSGKMI